jgi:hypothetical protein
MVARKQLEPEKMVKMPSLPLPEIWQESSDEP